MCAAVSTQDSATGAHTSITSAAVPWGKTSKAAIRNQRRLSQRINEETEGYSICSLEKDWLSMSIVTQKVSADLVTTSKSNSSSKRGKENVYTLDFVSGT